MPPPDQHLHPEGLSVDPHPEKSPTETPTGDPTLLIHL